MSVFAHVGIMVPVPHYYYPPIISGAQRVLDDRRIRRTLALSSYDPTRDEVLTRELLDAGCTGLLPSPNVAIDEDGPARLDWLFELPVPTVLVERTVAAPMHGGTLRSVRTDHDAGCLRAVRYLRGLGHGGVG